MPRRIKAYKLYGALDFGPWRPIGTAILTDGGWQYECAERVRRPRMTMYAGGGSLALMGFLIEKGFKWLIDITTDQEGKIIYRYITLDKLLRTSFVEEERGIKGLYSGYINWNMGKPDTYKGTKRRWLPRIRIYGHYAEALLPYLQEQEYFIKGLTQERTWAVSQVVGGETA